MVSVKWTQLNNVQRLISCLQSRSYGFSASKVNEKTARLAKQSENDAGFHINSKEFNLMEESQQIQAIILIEFYEFLHQMKYCFSFHSFSSSVSFFRSTIFPLVLSLSFPPSLREGQALPCSLIFSLTFLLILSFLSLVLSRFSSLQFPSFSHSFSVTLILKLLTRFLLLLLEVKPSSKPWSQPNALIACDFFPRHHISSHESENQVILWWIIRLLVYLFHIRCDVIHLLNWQPKQKWQTSNESPFIPAINFVHCCVFRAFAFRTVCSETVGLFETLFFFSLASNNHFYEWNEKRWFSIKTEFPQWIECTLTPPPKLVSGKMCIFINYDSDIMRCKEFLIWISFLCTCRHCHRHSMAATLLLHASNLLSGAAAHEKLYHPFKLKKGFNYVSSSSSFPRHTSIKCQ